VPIGIKAKPKGPTFSPISIDSMRNHPIDIKQIANLLTFESEDNAVACPRSHNCAVIQALLQQE
jgi:hypothetical protein